MAKHSNKPTPPNSTGKKSTHVPFHYAGYSLQTTCLAARAIQAEPGSILSLEVFEDIGVEQPDGTRVAVQSKSTLDGNPVSDRAVDLWKTFSNWVDAVKSRELDSQKTRFEMYVSKPVSGSIVESFSQASSNPQALKALENARNLLWGMPPTYPLKSQLADSIRDYVNNVLEADETVTVPIIVSFSLTLGSGIPQKDFEDLFKKTIVPEEIIDLVSNQALGWVKSRTDELLQRGKPAYVARDEFFKEITAFIRRVDRRNLLCSFAPKPTQEQIDSDIAAKTYVRQLEIINVEYDDQVEAVTDYLRASSDRTIWSVRGLVHKDSFDEFEEGLQRTWKNLKTEADLTCSSNDEVSKGKLLYSKCSQHRAKLENMDLEDHFTRGSFHALSDEKIIGWHPDYKSKV